MFLKASYLDEHSRIACTNCAECTRIGRSVKRAFFSPVAKMYGYSSTKTIQCEEAQCFQGELGLKTPASSSEYRVCVSCFTY